MSKTRSTRNRSFSTVLFQERHNVDGFYRFLDTVCAGIDEPDRQVASPRKQSTATGVSVVHQSASVVAPAFQGGVASASGDVAMLPVDVKKSEPHMLAIADISQTYASSDYQVGHSGINDDSSAQVPWNY